MEHAYTDSTHDDEIAIRGIFLKIKDTAQFNFDPSELQTPQDCFEAYLTVLCADPCIYRELRKWANDYIMLLREQKTPAH